MNRKNTLITSLVNAILIFGVSLGVAVYRKDVSVKSWVEYVWLISMAFACIGLLCRSGAATGDTILKREGVLDTSQNRGGYIESDNDDAYFGMEFGMVVMLSSVFVFFGSLAILHFVYT